MTQALTHLRRNAVAYLALFVALGGTSYAAINLPAGSVGSKQLRNRSITPVKLDPAAIGGSVRHWASIGPTGVVGASGPRARVRHSPGSNAYDVSWNHKLPSDLRCGALATVANVGSAGFADALQMRGPDVVSVQTFDAHGQPAEEIFTVAVIC